VHLERLRSFLLQNPFCIVEVGWLLERDKDQREARLLCDGHLLLHTERRARIARSEQ
jgi:hypothetical protein